jgi:hypothetical protein
MMLEGEGGRKDRRLEESDGGEEARKEGRVRLEESMGLATNDGNGQIHNDANDVST